MTTTTPPLKQRLEAILPELIELRRHLHAHPELSGEEHQTAALISGELRQRGWRVRCSGTLFFFTDSFWILFWDIEK